MEGVSPAAHGYVRLSYGPPESDAAPDKKAGKPLLPPTLGGTATGAGTGTTALASGIQAAVGSPESGPGRMPDTTGETLSDTLHMSALREALLEKNLEGGDTKGAPSPQAASGGGTWSARLSGGEPLAEVIRQGRSRYAVIGDQAAMIVASSSDSSLAIVLTEKPLNQESEPAGSFFLTPLDPKTTYSNAAYFVPGAPMNQLAEAAKQLPIKSIANECGWGTLFGKNLKFNATGTDQLAYTPPDFLPGRET